MIRIGIIIMMLTVIRYYFVFMMVMYNKLMSEQKSGCNTEYYAYQNISHGGKYKD